MSEKGTALDELDSGEVANAADAGRMANILRDMNASGADVIDGPPSGNAPMPQMHHQMQPPPMGMKMQPMPPMMQQQQMMQQQMMQQQHQKPNVQMYEEEEQGEVVSRKNIWGRILDIILDPFFVALLIFVLSLPALHTFVGKYASWAYVVGGQLSWTGLLIKALLGGLLFGLYKFGSSFISV